jgi:hypothetical protein
VVLVALWEIGVGQTASDVMVEETSIWCPVWGLLSWLVHCYYCQQGVRVSKGGRVLNQLIWDHEIQLTCNCFGLQPGQQGDTMVSVRHRVNSSQAMKISLI